MKNEVLVMVAVGFYILNNAKNRFFENIKWNFDGIDLDGLGFDESIRLLVRLKIKNTTGNTIAFEGFEGKLQYLGKDLTTVKGIDRVNLVAQETTLRFLVPIKYKTLETVFGVTWKEFLQNFKNIIRPSNYRLIGRIYIRFEGIAYNFDINEPFVYS